MTEAYNQEQVDRRQAAVDIAVLKTQMEHRDTQVIELTTAVKNLADKVDTIAVTLAEAKGGWRMLMAVGGAGGIAGGLLQWVFSHISLKGTP